MMEDPSPINYMNMVTLTGEDQAMSWCKDIYDANGIADLAANTTTSMMVTPKMIIK